MYKEIKNKKDIIPGRSYLILFPGITSRKYMREGHIYIYTKNIIGEYFMKYSHHNLNKVIFESVENVGYYFNDIRDKIRVGRHDDYIVYEIESEEDVMEIQSKYLMLRELKK